MELEMDGPTEKRLPSSVPIFLPDEIVSDILSRLSSESLIRFSTVSKSWYSLFRSPNFIAAHLNRSISRNDANVLIFPAKLKYNDDNTCYVLSEETLIQNKKFDFPCSRNRYEFLMLGCENCSSDGLICLNGNFRSAHKLYLCNPSIRKVKTLPPSCSVPSLHGRLFYSVFGFGFDGVGFDYKVVRIFYNSHDLRMAPRAEVYSLKTNSWKMVKFNVGRQVVSMYFSSASYRGAIHWFAVADFGNPSVILCFDVSKEVFWEMILPVGLSGSRKGSVFMFKGLLAVLIEIDDIVFDDHLQYEVWVMREYGFAESWAKQFTGMVPDVWKGEVGFTKSGKLILRKHDGVLALLDLEKPQLEDLGFRERSYRVSDYTETLVLLDDGVSSVVESEMLNHQISEDLRSISSSKEEDNDAAWISAINSSLATTSCNSFFGSGQTMWSQEGDINPINF